MCRLKGVSFDLQERTGTVFNLMDSFVGGVLGVLTAGRSMLDALRKRDAPPPAADAPTAAPRACAARTLPVAHDERLVRLALAVDAPRAGTARRWGPTRASRRRARTRCRSRT
eukprot:3669372-Prymnesium_polylepis.3